MKSNLTPSELDVSALKQKISDLSHAWNEQFGKFTDEVKKYSKKGKEAAADTVSDNPLRSVGIALTCGLVIGFLIGRGK